MSGARNGSRSEIVPGRGGRRTSSGSAAQLGRREREDLLHGLVERPDAGEARGERDVGHRQLAGLDQQPRGLCALGAGERERAGAELGQQLALDLADAVAELCGQARYAVAVDHAVRDQPHRAGDQVGAVVPLRRARARVGPAALAGAESGLLRGRGARVEPHVLDLRRHHRAARPAVDLRGQHRGEEPPVEARVLRLDGPDASLPALVHVLQHPCRHRQFSSGFAPSRHRENATPGSGVRFPPASAARSSVDLRT